MSLCRFGAAGEAPGRRVAGCSETRHRTYSCSTQQEVFGRARSSTHSDFELPHPPNRNSANSYVGGTMTKKQASWRARGRNSGGRWLSVSRNSSTCPLFPPSRAPNWDYIVQISTFYRYREAPVSVSCISRLVVLVGLGDCWARRDDDAPSRPLATSCSHFPRSTYVSIFLLLSHSVLAPSFSPTSPRYAFPFPLPPDHGDTRTSRATGQ